jgi:hypothetical protein
LLHFVPVPDSTTKSGVMSFSVLGDFPGLDIDRT